MGICSSVVEAISAGVRWFFPKKKTVEPEDYIIPRSYSPSSFYRPTTTTHQVNTTVVLPVVCKRNAVKTTPLSFLEMVQLDSYPMPSHIMEIERNDNVATEHSQWLNTWLAQKTEFRASEENYIAAYRTMLFFEEAVETIEIGANNIPGVQLQQIKNKKFSFNVPLDSEKLIAAINDNQLTRFTLKSKKRFFELQGKILKILKNHKIFVEILKPWEWSSDAIYDVHFDINQTNYQLQHNALDYIHKHRLFSILINNPLYHRPNAGPLDRSIGQFATNQRDLNLEQKQAIEAIVSGHYRPLPYLLYGPPGTGKTKTIVAAIETIVRNTTKKILVCAQSNAACNEIAERLAKVLTDTELLRMFSQSYDVNDISSTLKPFSNSFDDKLKYPSRNYLYNFRVLIATLSVSGCLARSVDRWDPEHFDYVFIDECASAIETMTLIPIAGLCTSRDSVYANIVLCGDPKQLDAVTKSNWSTLLGLKVSWFEQLFQTALYRRRKETGEFDATYITQLTRNYRSHSAILTIPNELFYDKSLKSVAVPDVIKLELDGLSSQNFPIIFKSVHGNCKSPEDDTSSFNIAEVESVMEFIEKLLAVHHYKLTQFDVGVVSPYRLQCSIIRKRCWHRGYKNIIIGSAEQFQGQERAVMIISTVRSGRRSLGDFVKNPQRFNVMITRAKSLLIVVGNPHLLSQDENWSKFIGFCCRNGGLVQDKSSYFRPQNLRQWQ